MDRRVEIVLTLIQNDIRKNPTVSQLARLVHLSPSRFEHIFRTETNVSLVQYVKSLKLRKARDLLETTFLNVKEIMAIVGVNDLSHFVRDFKKVFGVTPSEYRKSKPIGEHPLVSKQPGRPTNGRFR